MKRIFYYTDVLPFLSREEDALEKLKRNLAIFRQSAGELRLVWHPWSRTAEYLQRNESPVAAAYQAVLDTFRAEGWGELDETASFAEAREVLLSCNAYYGDVCDLVYDAQDAGLPVMLQSIDV